MYNISIWFALFLGIVLVCVTLAMAVLASMIIAQFIDGGVMWLYGFLN